jgi:aromatic ring-opening dioxygenase catalytic subunit (LigB family)
MAAAPAVRAGALVNWESAPAARICHPREEHLLPLMVAVGAAYDDAAECVYHDEAVFGGVTASSFRFGTTS